MFWKKNTSIEEIQKIVSQLADYLLVNGVNNDFRVLAKEKAKKIKLKNWGILKEIFHNPPKDSKVYDVKKHGLGGWVSARQFSIFELLYNFGEPALPFIREIAWGEYDWTQGNAIELLIRFASDGVCRDEIIAEIQQNFPKIRYEAQLYAIQPLIGQLKTNNQLKSVFDELMKIKEFKESFYELTESNA